MKTLRTFFISAVLTLAYALTAECQVPGQHSFQFRGETLRAALDSLMRWYQVSVVYLDREVEGKEVTASCTSCGFEAAIAEVLRGSTLDCVQIGSQFVLRKRDIPPTAPPATVSGTVRDSLSGEAVADCIVELSSGNDGTNAPVLRRISANAFGFFSLRKIPSGAYAVVVRAIGYHPSRRVIIIDKETNIRGDITLQRRSFTMQEVTVEGYRSSLAFGDQISRGLYLHATPMDHNEYLLDGGRIYNPVHYGGTLSSIDDEALNDVLVPSGGLPPSYGGEVGGVIDLSMRSGNRERFTGSAGTGSLGSSLSFEGPIDDASTFLATARRSYPNPAVPSFRASGDENRTGSSEILAKANFRLSGGSQLSANGYLGRDEYTNFVNGGYLSLSNNFSWGNALLNLRWFAVAAPSLFIHANATFTRYDIALQHLLSGQNIAGGNANLSSNFFIEDAGVSAYAENFYDDEHTFLLGIHVTRHRLAGTVSQFSTQTAGFNAPGSTAWENAIYAEDEWRILPRVSAAIGGRLTSYAAEKSTYSGVDPRIALRVQLSDASMVYGSLSTVNQFIHPYRNSGVFQMYPAIFWYSSNDRITPMTSQQTTIGFTTKLGSSGATLTAETFYRRISNLHDFAADTSSAGNQTLTEVIRSGSSDAFGVELALRKRDGDLTGTLTYNLSWAHNAFGEISSGQPSLPSNQRRHEIQAAVWYSPGTRWVFGLQCVLTSQYPDYTGPSTVSNATASFDPRSALPDLNSDRLPGLKRLEIHAAYSLDLWNAPCRLSLRLLNSYGLIDPFQWNLHAGTTQRTFWTATLKNLPLFPLYPACTLSVQL